MKHLTLRGRQRGQATTETMLVMGFLALFVFGAVHLSMFAVTRSMVNLAAFDAARTVMVRGAGYEAWLAADQVLDGWQWRGGGWQDCPDPIGQTTHRGRRSLFVDYRVPFGLPIFNDVPHGGLRVRGYATYVFRDVPEEGDNAR